RNALLVFLSGPIIDFLEELVVLADLGIVRIELERFLVRLARLLELSLVLVTDREIVVCGGVGWIDLSRLFPTVDRFTPEPALGDADPEFDLGLRVFLGVSGRRHGDQHRGRRDDRDRADVHGEFQGHYTVPSGRTEQAICHASTEESGRNCTIRAAPRYEMP